MPSPLFVHPLSPYRFRPRGPSLPAAGLLLLLLLAGWFGPLQALQDVPPAQDRSPGPTGTASGQEVGMLQGRITTTFSGENLQGASLRIVGTGRTAESDGQGLYRFLDVPVGEHELAIRYLGLDSQTRTVTVRTGQVTTVDFALNSDIFELASVTVEAQVGGQAAALNQQRTAPNIRDVASRDALARVRDGQIGEAVNTLPGVYMNLEILSPTRPVVRGLGDSFNSVTVDGIRLGDQSGGRSTRIRYYPGEIVGQVEVIKAVTPDMEGDAIGGTVNLVSRRAIEQTRRTFTVGTGGSYNNIQENFNRQANLTFGDRFGADGRLGVFLTANLYEVSQGYPQLSTGYAVNDADEFRITAVTANERIENRSRTMNWGLTTDYQITPHTLLSLRGSYLRDARRLEDYRAIYTLGTLESFDANSGVYRNGRIDLTRALRYPVSGSQVYGAQVRHDFGATALDYRVAYAQATNSYDRTFFPTVRANGVDFTYDRTLRDFPALSVRNGVDQNDPGNYVHQQVQRPQAPSKDAEYSADLNLRRGFEAFQGTSYLKTGARGKFRRFTIGDDDAGYYNYVGGLPVSAFLDEFRTARPFMPAGGGRVLFPRINPSINDGSSYEDLFFSDPSAFARQENRSDILLANRNTSFQEDIVAGYLMGGAQFGRMGLLGGVRVEHTSFQGEANQVTTEQGAVVDVTPVTNTSSYTNLLPGVHLTWSHTENLLVRGSVNRTLARPNGRSMQPVRTVNEDSRTLNDGNPDLSVTSSTNLDVSLEYYIRPLGLASVGVFHKRIDGFYTSSRETLGTGTYAGYDLVMPAMGTGGEITGVELGWQQRMEFLPGPLADMGFMVNATFLDADGRYPNRPDERLAFTNTARRLLNANLYYARGPLDSRILYNWRDRYLTSVGNRPALDRYEDSRGTLDFLVSWRFNDRMRANLDWKNITNSPIRTYQGSRENPTALRYFDYAVIFGVSIEL